MRRGEGVSNARSGLVGEWAAVPIGAPVIVTLDDGTEWRTKTRSAPRQLGDGTPVILLVGKSGGYRLERVRTEMSGSLGPQ